MNYNKCRTLIKFDEGGKGDITPLLENQKIFRQIVRDLCQPFQNEHVAKIAGLEARGFVFAGAMAYKLKTGVALVRKCGKIPINVCQLNCVDYSGQTKCLEMSKDAIKNGDRVLVADDWLETGSQMKSAVALIEKLGGIVCGIAVLIDQASPEAKKFLSNYRFHSLIKIPKR